MTYSTTHLFGGALFSAGLARHRSTKQGCGRIVAAFVATASLVTAPALVADIINVPDDFPTIQGAIDASVNGDEIIVAPGEYVESIDFLGKAILLRSSRGRDVTTIDGDGATVVRGADDGTTFTGFTVTGGFFGMSNYEADPTIIACTFTANTTGMYNSCNPQFGGGPVIIECAFTDNGTGMDNFLSRATAIGCEFRDNTWGIRSDYFASASCINCTITSNSSSGILADNYSGAHLANCEITDNGFDGIDGGSFSGVFATNCTIAYNGGHGVGEIGYLGSVSLVSCVVWGNYEGQVGSGDSCVTYSDIEGGFAGAGNIDADPLFLDPENGDFYPSPGSPCIDAGDNASVPDDDFDLDGDGDTDEPLPIDLDGNARFVDDPNTKDTGNGRPPIVDMGAYEFQVISCTWDLDDDGSVGTGDLILLLGSWGDPYGTADLIELLGVWGPCPR